MATFPLSLRRQQKSNGGTESAEGSDQVEPTAVAEEEKKTKEEEDAEGVVWGLSPST